MRYNLLTLAFAARAIAHPTEATPVQSTTCNGKQYIYEGLAGFGYFPPAQIDSLGDTIGGIGSSAALDIDSWKLVGKDKYEGDIYTLPDRGFNVNGTINYQARIQKFKLTFDAGQTSGTINKTNIQLKYETTIPLVDPAGVPTSGLDGDVTYQKSSLYPGFPDLPLVHYTGDGFGGDGPGGVRVVMDPEGLVLDKSDGGFWVSDEYGPYIYKFNKGGKMTGAIRPPDAIIPIRGGKQSFSANSPPIYNQTIKVVPGDPTSGRQNNQGLEGLTTDPKGKTIYALVQSALRQDGGNGTSSNRYYTRLLKYAITSKGQELTGEYVVRLPQDSKNATAAQSEIHYISDTQFLVLARDSNNGRGLASTNSTYRHADVFDISKATDIKGKYDAINGSITTNNKDGILKDGIVPATYCSFINYNDKTQLSRFGLHNGGVDDRALLNEKWESLVVVPTLEKHSSDEYFLISLSDNDFRGINIRAGGHTFHDTVDLDNQVLVFKIKLPAGSKPLYG